MKKSILNFADVKELSRKELRNINGAVGQCADDSGRMGPCEEDSSPTGPGLCFNTWGAAYIC